MNSTPFLTVLGKDVKTMVEELSSHHAFCCLARLVGLSYSVLFSFSFLSNQIVAPWTILVCIKCDITLTFVRIFDFRFFLLGLTVS